MIASILSWIENNIVGLKASKMLNGSRKKDVVLGKHFLTLMQSNRIDSDVVQSKVTYDYT